MNLVFHFRVQFTRVRSGQVNTVKFRVKSGVRTGKHFLLSQLLAPLWSDDQSRPQKILNVCTYACIRFMLTKKSPILFSQYKQKKTKTFPEKIFLILLTPTGTVPPHTKGLTPKRKRVRGKAVERIGWGRPFLVRHVLDLKIGPPPWRGIITWIPVIRLWAWAWTI